MNESVLYPWLLQTGKLRRCIKHRTFIAASELFAGRKASADAGI